MAACSHGGGRLPRGERCPMTPFTNKSIDMPLLQDRKGFHLLFCISIAVAAITVWASTAQCQQLVPETPIERGEAKTNPNNPEPESKRIMGIIPNYRTSPDPGHYESIPTREKFRLAAEDSFDRGTIALAAIFGAEGQLTNANRSFGQGGTAFGKYFGSSYGDFVIANYMTEGVFPTLLHQDPRYFRRGTGSGWSRLRYSMGQIFWTHSDSGRTQFNYSEVFGNSTAVAISTAYYKNGRNASDAVSGLGVQLSVDMASNVLKEFWPEIERKFRRKHAREFP
jgi:hypothetical protein